MSSGEKTKDRGWSVRVPKRGENITVNPKLGKHGERPNASVDGPRLGASWWEQLPREGATDLARAKFVRRPSGEGMAYVGRAQ